MTDLAGQTLAVLGGSSGIGLETARLARAGGADVVLVGRNPERLEAAAREVDARATAAFDVSDDPSLTRFFAEWAGQLDHVLLTAGTPYYAPIAEMDLQKARRDVDEHLWTAIRVAQLLPEVLRSGGTLTLMSGTGGRRPAVGLAVMTTMTHGTPALTANLAVELAPIRVNCVAPGFVDTPLSATLLGDDLDARRRQLRETLPIRRVVGPQDVAALVVHLLTNTALTGATFDIDGGQGLLRS